MLHFNVKDIKGVCPLEIFETLEARWQQISKKGYLLQLGHLLKRREMKQVNKENSK